MKRINLVSLENSEIKYEVSKFPDGQQQVKVLLYNAENTIITIKSRLNNFKDLELITCTVASLREAGVKEIHLYVPYFLGSRSDRKFETGSNNYLKKVICPFINLLNFDSVTVLDPHSDVLESCITNFQKISNHAFVKQALVQINNKHDAHEKTILLSPDAGALKKIYTVAESVYFKGDIICCSKSRNTDGQLTKTIVPLDYKPSNLIKDIVVIDDICDGGRTFINIAKELKENHHLGKRYLVVTHGIFSNGFGELMQYFDAIYTTNSYLDLNPDTEPFVKQLNVF